MSDDETRLGDLVKCWIEEHPRLRGHIGVDMATDGFFVDLVCAKVDSVVFEVEPHGPLVVAFIADRKRNDGFAASWLHNMNPSDPSYFAKLEILFIEWHNNLQHDIGCEKRL